MYFCGAASNSALCSALAKRKVTPSNWLVNCGLPGTYLPPRKATTSAPLSITRGSPPSATAFTGRSLPEGFCAVIDVQPPNKAAHSAPMAAM